MKLEGFLLLPAGWALIVVAVSIFHSQVIASIFVIAGLLVEVLGLVLVARRQRRSTGGSH